MTENKEYLEKIKDVLEEVSPTIDISNIYVYTLNGVHNIAKLNIINNDEAIVSDVFIESIIYKKDKLSELQNKSYFKLIVEVEPNLSNYPDNRVPLEVLKQLYYKLNNVNVNSTVIIKSEGKQK